MLEKLVFGAVLLVFCYLFWRGIRHKLKLIRNAKPDKFSRLSEFGRRVKRFIFEVLLQGQVIKGRPFVGIMHALVFAGFLAFAIETVNHFTEFFGLAFLPPDCSYRTLVLKIVAILTLLGIAALAIRRFICRPKHLGSVSYTSGMVALLIAVLMVTFLIGLYAADDSLAEKFNWWIHTLAILGFLALIPRSKHLHLALAPLNVFLRSFDLANLSRLDLEKEEFGLIQNQDLERKNVLDAFSCVECGRCQEQCPVFNADQELNPRQLILDVQRGLLKNPGDANLIGASIESKILWQCTTCGACENICPVGIEHLPLIVGMRRGQIANGEGSRRAFAVLNALEQGRNPWGLATVYDPIKDFKIPEFKKGSRYLLWTGCAGLVDDRYQKVMAALVELLKIANVDFGAVAFGQNCGGDLARRLGNELVFEQIATQNIELLKSLNSPVIITACPHCLQTLGKDYRGFGGDFRVIHHSQILGQIAARLQPFSRKDTKVTYQDPCYLGRYNKIFSSPRELVGICGSEIVELPHNKEKSFCCGAGGGRMFLEEAGPAINVSRAREISRLGVKTVVTACPFCLTMLRDGLSSIGQDASVKDVAEFLLENLGPQTERRDDHALVR